MELPKKKTISADEYFKMESDSETKSEYYHGEIFAMTGASFRHNFIVSNLIISLGNEFKGFDCIVLPSDIKVELEYDRHYSYPDIAVVCGEVKMAKDRNDTIANPKIIVEVLSKSTRDYDKGTKFTAYRKIPSLTDFITVDQYAIAVEHYRKEGPGRWSLTEHENIDDSLMLPEFEIALPLSNIYDRIKLDEALL